MAREYRDLVGERFGRWEVLSEAGRDRHGFRKWACRCECGTVRDVLAHSLIHGRSKSCGCLNREKIAERRRTHGGCEHPLYLTWKLIRQRCRNPNDPSYPNYGGRGITVDARWDDFGQFLSDMGERPPNPAGWRSRKPYWTLDRIDNNGPYSPENCRWATIIQQRKNQRPKVRNAQYDELVRRNEELEAEILVLRARLSEAA